MPPQRHTPSTSRGTVGATMDKLSVNVIIVDQSIPWPTLRGGYVRALSGPDHDGIIHPSSISEVYYRARKQPQWGKNQQKSIG